MSLNRSSIARETVAAGLLFGLADAALLQWTAYVVAPMALLVTAFTAAVVMVLVHTGLAFATRSARLPAWLAPVGTVLVYTALRLRAARAISGWHWLWIAIVLVVASQVMVRSRRDGSASPTPWLSLVSLAILPWLLVGPAAGGAALAAGVPGRLPAGAVLVGLIVAGLWLRWTQPARHVVASVLLLAAVMALTYPWIPGPGDCDLSVAGEAGSGSGGRSAAATTDLVVVVVMDTVSAARTSLYGATVPTTPGLESLAGTATVHTSAWSEASWSLPSHASLLTGYLPHEHGAHRVLVRADQPGRWTVAVRPLDARIPTLPERLRAAGIRTAVAAANYGYFSPAYGLTRGFEQVHSCPRNLLSHEALAAPLWRRLGALEGMLGAAYRTRFTAAQMLELAIGWIDNAGEGPLFMLVNLMDAHPPTFASEHTRRFPEVAREDGREPDLRDYDLAIRSIDEALTEFVESLRASGRFDDAMLVVTSDHGETFWENGSAHASTLRASETRIPMLVKEPGQRQGRRLDEPVQLSDLARWIAAALGVPGAAADSSLPPGVAVMESYLSLPLGQGPLEVSLEEAPRVRPSHWSLVRDGWQVILGDDHGHELFDVSAAVAMEAAQDASADDRAASMIALLRDLLPGAAFEVDLVESLEAPDEEVLERLRSLGYIQ